MAREKVTQLPISYLLGYFLVFQGFTQQFPSPYRLPNPGSWVRIPQGAPIKSRVFATRSGRPSSRGTQREHWRALDARITAIISLRFSKRPAIIASDCGCGRLRGEGVKSESERVRTRCCSRTEILSKSPRLKLYATSVDSGATAPIAFASMSLVAYFTRARWPDGCVGQQNRDSVTGSKKPTADNLSPTKFGPRECCAETDSKRLFVPRCAFL